VPTPPIAPGTASILLACVEAEHHTLPLAALAAALGAQRIPVRMLGAATPTQSLVRAVRDTSPAAVVLWSQRPDTAGHSILRLLNSYPASLFTAGPGWPDGGPDGVTLLTGPVNGHPNGVSAPSDPSRTPFPLSTSRSLQ
jgi:hypothetical protein